MFLDEHLYTHTKSKEIRNADDFKDLINELYRICEDHYKHGLLQERDKKVVKAALDRTFRSWDIFIEKLKKEDWFLIDVLAKYDTSYKAVFMSHPRLKEIYEGL